MRIATLPLAFVVVSSAFAEEGGRKLWQNIDAGMPAERVRELYPAQKGSVHHKPKVTIIEGVQDVGRCHPDVHVIHSKGSVERVEVHSRLRGFPAETCGDEAAKALLAKYGAPTDEDGTVQETGGIITSGLLKGLDTTRNERSIKQVWLRNGVLVTFDRDDPEVYDTWTITYEVPAESGL